MSINYRTRHTSAVKDGFAQILREAQEAFAGERIQMLGTGINEILGEDVLFASYKDSLMKGVDADMAAVLEQLMENTRTHCLSESSLAGIQPITALTMPTLRKSWPRIGVTEAIPTEAVKLPKFSISYMEPWIKDAAGTKYALPAALRGGSAAARANRLQLDTAAILVPSGLTNGVCDLFALMSPSIDPAATGDSVDRDFYISEVTLRDDDTGGPHTGGTVATNIRLETTHSSLYGDVAVGGVTDTIFGKLNRETGHLTFASVKGNVTSFKVVGFVSSELNNHTEQVGFDIRLKEVDIPTGAHITAPLPIEWLQDTMAMYQIDGAMKVIDIMSDVFAQKIDMEGIGFLDAAHTANLAGVPYAATFNMRPPVGFAGSSKDWRDEFRTVVDHLAITMKNDSAFNQGKFALLGNDLDTTIVPNVEWIFNSNNDERAGVDVNYSIGAYSGANRYTIVSTPNVTAGTMYLIYIPTNADQMTFKYFPYAFAVERANGYLDPKNPNVPSVVMTRRQVFEKFTPLIAKITISGNSISTTYSPLADRESA